MKKVKKAAAIFIGLMVAVLGFANNTYAEEAVWDIENTLDILECRQGDTVTMSINLKGSGASSPQELHYMKGTLEYDSSLFTVERADILPAEGAKVQSCSFDQNSRNAWILWKRTGCLRPAAHYSMEMKFVKLLCSKRKT